jgi:hypothetical protein
MTKPCWTTRVKCNRTNVPLQMHRYVCNSEISNSYVKLLHSVSQCRKTIFGGITMKIWSRVTRILLAALVATQGAAFLPAMAASQSKRLAVKAIGIEELKSEYGAGGGSGGTPVVLDQGTPSGGNPNCQYNWNANNYCDWVDRSTIIQVTTETGEWTEFRDIGFPLVSCTTTGPATCNQISYEGSLAVAVNIQFGVSDPLGVFSGATSITIQPGANLSASFQDVPNGTAFKGFLKLIWKRTGGHYTAMYKDDMGQVGRFTVGNYWTYTQTTSTSFTILKRPTGVTSWVSPNRGF